MSLWRRVSNRWKRSAVHAEIDEELRSHLAMAEEDGMRSGMAAGEARRTAHVRFGNVNRMRERAHRADVALPFDGWGTAVRATLRGLRKSSGFTVTVVLTLALGIGATTALFTLVYDVMLRPLPFANADRLVLIQEKVAEWSALSPTLPVSANHFTQWKEHTRSFSSMAAMKEFSVPLGASGRPLQVGVLNATASIFPVLEVRPSMGRAFTVNDAQPGRDHVAVLTDALWRQQFGRDNAIVGKTIRLDGFPYTVIGVMPRSFHMPSISSMGSPGSAGRTLPLGVLTPLVFSKERLTQQMGDLDYIGLGRLKAGVFVAAATADLDALQHAISESLPANEKATLSVALTPLQQALVGTNQKPLMILLIAVLGLLVVGCVNIANLLLARGVGKQQQMALVCALGAGRAAMLRMAFRETVVLAVSGGTLGVALAASLLPWMGRYLPPVLRFRGTLHLDWAGVGIALLLATLAMVAAGGVPAWRAARTAPQEVLHSEARLATEARGSRRVRRVLVGVEAALSAALLLTAGLLALSVQKLLHVERGFSVARTMTATLELPNRQYHSDGLRAQFYRELLSRLHDQPGVEHAAITSVLPLTGDSWGDMAQLPGDTRPFTDAPIESFRWVSSGYFRAIDLPLVRGRLFSPEDWGRDVAVISQKTARSLWQGKDPVGRQFFRDGEAKPLFTVVGVVGDARTISLTKPDPMMIYVPYWYRADTTAGLVVRTRQNPAAMAASIRKAVWSIDPGVPVPAMRTLGGIVTDSVVDQRFERDLLVLFAASALLLAALGVYGVVSYSVEQRRREIGLRLALGAPRASVYGMVLRDGLPPIAAGIVAGVVLVFAAGRLLRALLFGVTPYDPLVALGAAALLLLVGIAACMLPARRAAAVEPMEALRAE